MKNTMKKLAIVVGSVSAVVMPMFASAAAFSTSTAISTVTDHIADVALIIGGVVVAILSLLAALTGLGWGVRKFRHYVSGRKF